MLRKKEQSTLCSFFVVIAIRIKEEDGVKTTGPAGGHDLLLLTFRLFSVTFRVLSVNFFESHELSTLSVDVFYLHRGRMIYKHSSVDAHISQSSLLFHIDFILYFIFSISLFDTLVTVTAPITVSVPIAITKQGFHLLGSDFLNSIVFFSFFL